MNDFVDLSEQKVARKLKGLDIETGAAGELRLVGW